MTAHARTLAASKQFTPPFTPLPLKGHGTPACKDDDMSVARGTRDISSRANPAAAPSAVVFGVVGCVDDLPQRFTHITYWCTIQPMNPSRLPPADSSQWPLLVFPLEPGRTTPSHLWGSYPGVLEAQKKQRSTASLSPRPLA